MITLGIETATAAISVALGGQDGILGHVEIHQGRRHAEVLTPAIEFLCHHAQVPVASIDAIGVDIGPGLFTGMRVGIATATAMGMALAAPVIGICSLDQLAHAHVGVAHASERIILSVIDARKGEVFYAFYRPTETGAQRVSEPRAGSIAELNADAMARGQDGVAVGDGAWRYRDEIHASMQPLALAHPSAVALVDLARPLALLADESTLAPVEPMYLRAPDAQINWSSR